MRCFGALLLTIAALAQTPPAHKRDAPPEIEQALRARITRFFQAHVDGKPRLAMPLVAEDSQDYFFAMEKPQYPGFEIGSIQFFDNFTRAVAVVNCEQEITVQMFGKRRVKLPRTTNWKIENGQWVWFATKAEREAPGGGVTIGTGPNPTPKMPGPSGAEARLNVLKDVSQLNTDKNEVRLQSGKESSDSVTVSNPLSGWVTIDVMLPEVPGLTAKVDKKDVPPNGAGRVEFIYKPAGPLTALQHRAVIRLLPMGREFPVKIVFQAATEQPAAVAAKPAKETTAPAPAKKKAAPKKRR